MKKILIISLLTSLSFLTFGQSRKISQLPTATNLTSSFIPIIQDSSGQYVNRKFAGSGVNNYTASNGVTISSSDIQLSNVYVVSSIANLNTYIGTLAAGTDIHILFPNDIDVSTVITLNNLGHVFIEGDAVLRNTRTTSGYIFDITNCDKLTIKDISINLNSDADATRGINISDIINNVTIDNINIYNFGTNTTVGIYAADVGGGGGSYTNGFEYPSIKIVNSNFYNNTVGTTSTFDYNSNGCKGRGIQFAATADYFVVTSCEFLGLNIGLWVGTANGAVTNSEFLWNNGYVSAVSYGSIYVESVPTNDGKISISNCKFNHNWSYAVNAANTTSVRAISINNCHFIANAIRPIILNPSNYSVISNNFFNASNLSQTNASNSPYTATACNYITLNNSTYVNIHNNYFANVTSSQPAIVSAGTADYNYIKNNVYEPGLTLLSLVGSNNVNMFNERKVTFLADATNPGLNVGSYAGNPSTLSNGDLWYNSTNAKLTTRENGATKNVIPINGSAALVGGTVTVNTTYVTATSRIFLTNRVSGGTPGLLSVGTVTAGTSFVINSSSGTDTSTISWMILEGN